MGAALVARDGVELVEDQGPRPTERLPATLRRQQDVEGLGCRNQDVRRPLDHRLALALGRVTRPDGRPNLRHRTTGRVCDGSNCGHRVRKVSFDVVGEGLEWRDVDDLRLVGQAAVQALTDEAVDACEECRECLARAGRCCDQRVSLLGDRGPALGLRRGRLFEAVQEPVTDKRMEFCNGHWVSQRSCTVDRLYRFPTVSGLEFGLSSRGSMMLEKRGLKALFPELTRHRPLSILTLTARRPVDMGRSGLSEGCPAAVLLHRRTLIQRVNSELRL